MQFLHIVAVVFAFVLFTYPSINSLIHQLRNCRGVRDFIDLISPKLGCFLNSKRNLQKLRNRIDEITSYINKFENERQRMIDLRREGMKLNEEAGEVIHHWTPSCYSLSRRVAELTVEIESFLYPQIQAHGGFTRGRISGMDKIGDSVREAVYDVWCLVRFNANINKLSNRIQRIQDHLVNTSDSGDGEHPQLLRALHVEAVELIEDAEHIKKRWSGSCFTLSKQVVSITSTIDQLLEDLR